jgi:aquaporin Z
VNSRPHSEEAPASTPSPGQPPARARAVAADSLARRALSASGKDLESASRFDDPAFEYRRLFAELLGTFLLVLVAAGAGVVGALPIGGGISLAMKVMAPGFMVMGIIYTMGTVSGAHLNPVVTWAFALRGDFPWYRVPGYLVAQAAGAFLAAWSLQALFGGIANGDTVVGAGITTWVAMLTEALLTAGLVLVILGTAYGARNVGPNSAIAVGFYIGLAGLWAAPVSGASMNPIRSLAPAAIAGDLTAIWVFFVGPFLGATVAVGFQYLLRGPASESGRLAASGTISPENPGGV